MSHHPVEISIVVPVHDESANVLALLGEIEAAMAGRHTFEAVFVDDASGDGTRRILVDHARGHPWLTVLAHQRNAGQSAAVRTGVRGARAPVIATLDGDGQNAPADIPALLARWREMTTRQPGRPVLITGWRQQRNDTGVRRLSSRIANRVRAGLLGDATPDTGCGLKVFGREDFLALPWFDHMHRFLPALVQRAGGTVVSVPVSHRPRRGGRSHYGIHNRLWVGLVDLAGVMWLQRRAGVTEVEHLTPASAAPVGDAASVLTA